MYAIILTAQLARYPFFATKTIMKFINYNNFNTLLSKCNNKIVSDEEWHIKW